MHQKVLVVDNGAYTIKAGYSNETAPKIIPNCVIKAKHERKRVFIGDQIKDCRDLSSLFYLLAFQKGFLNTTNEVLFEDYQFQCALRINAGTLAAEQYLHNNLEEKCCLVVDSGYSFTHITPVYNGKPVKEGIIRISVGGKVLTNYLKEMISYRQLQVMEETYVMNQCKEDSCFVSDNVQRDLQIAKQKGIGNSIVKEYVLPDFTTIQRGFLRDYKSSKEKDDAQVLKLNHERFMVPELLFHPSDIGIDEMGIPEAILHSVQEKCPSEMAYHLLKNIVLMGGNCLFSGFKDKLESDVRSLAPDLMDVKVTCPANPVTSAWEWGAFLGKDGEKVKDRVVTRKEYEEHGHRICKERFDL